MTADYGAGAGAVNVNVSGANLRLGPFDVGRTAREKSGSQREFSAICDLERFGEIAHFDHTEHRSENLFAGNLVLWADIGKDRRRNEKSFFRNISALEGETRFLFTALDVSENIFMRLAVDHWADSDSRIFWISNAKAGRSIEQALNRARINFVQNNQTRTSGTFLSLIAERGINRIDDRFVEVRVRIDNDRILAAHLADDVFELALAISRFARAFKNSQTDFARTGERDKIDILVVDQMRAHDRTFARQIVQDTRRNAGLFENFHQHGAENG